ncbi:hypothetical protein OY671_012541, partial [Metschnikowia pulcherrima]
AGAGAGHAGASAGRRHGRADRRRAPGPGRHSIRRLQRGNSRAAEAPARGHAQARAASGAPGARCPLPPAHSGIDGSPATSDSRPRRSPGCLVRGHRSAGVSPRDRHVIAATPGACPPSPSARPPCRRATRPASRAVP